MSVQYLIPAVVIEYIDQHGLYQEDGASSVDGKEESRGTESSGRASPAASSFGRKLDEINEVELPRNNPCNATP